MDLVSNFVDNEEFHNVLVDITTKEEFDKQQLLSQISALKAQIKDIESSIDQNVDTVTNDFSSYW